MFIGVSAFFHESSIALINNEGELLDFQKEEWHSRVKGDKTFPRLSLKKIINDHELIEEDIRFVFYEKPLKSWLTIIQHSIKNKGLLNSLTLNYFKNFWKSSISFYFELLSNIKSKSVKTFYCEHHLSHSLTADYYGMKYPYISVVIDGFGDNKCSSVYLFKSSNDFETIWTSDYPNSLGLFYSAITDFLGYPINSGEYKVMGLSAFGEPNYVDQLNQMIRFHEGQLFLEMSYFDFDSSVTNSYSKELENIFGVKSNNSIDTIEKSKNFQIYADIACSAQVVIYEIIKNIFKYSFNKTGVKEFSFTGGVALNSKLIKNLAQCDFIEKLFVPPSPGDSGAAIGAAYFGYLIHNEKNKNKNINKNNMIYPGYFKQEPDFIDEALEKYCGKNEIIAQTVNLLKKDEILATCISNIETGPRSLGNRSLICNADNYDLVKNLSNNLKGRESFIPTAPSMLLETAKKYYHINENIIKCYNTMGALADLKTDYQDFKFKSIVHKDLTSRIHISSEDSFIGKVLKFENQQIEIIANTSFNYKNDPISYGYEDSILALKKMNLKYLITDYGIYKVK
tara:strand:- start:1195 stop:2895 length:1701 start_codon:yes stop_codon:yes gene_type:complete